MTDLLINKGGGDETVKKFLYSLLEPLQTLTDELKTFETGEKKRARWNGQKMVLQAALNDIFGVTSAPFILVETIIPPYTYFFEPAENNPVYFFEWLEEFVIPPEDWTDFESAWDDKTEDSFVLIRDSANLNDYFSYQPLTIDALSTIEIIITLTVSGTFTFGSGGAGFQLYLGNIDSQGAGGTGTVELLEGEAGDISLSNSVAPSAITDVPGTYKLKFTLTDTGANGGTDALFVVGLGTPDTGEVTTEITFDVDGSPVYFYEEDELTLTSFKVLIPEGIHTAELERQVRAQTNLYKLAGKTFEIETY